MSFTDRLSLEHLKAAGKGDEGMAFSDECCCMPLEEVDIYRPGKTFCVITKVLTQYVVHRFSTEKTLFLFGPLHPFRMWAIYIQTDMLVQYVVTLGIIANCVMMTQEQGQNPSKYAFFSIFLIELLVSFISRGIVLHPHSILRIPLRWLDVISMIGSTIDVVAGSGKIGIGTSLFRTFRLINIIKTISIIPGLKVVISGLIRSLKMVTDMFIITLCLMILFSLLGKMVFEDSLSNKCVRIGTDKDNKSNWRIQYDDQYQVCGYSALSNKSTCPVNFVCEMAGTTPYDGLIGFDTIGGAMFTVWRLLTLDTWEEFYRQAISSKGPTVVMYFVVLIFLGSFSIMNLPIAMVISSYATEVDIAMEEHSREVKELSHYRKSSEFFYDPSNLIIQIYQPHRKPARLMRRMAAVEVEVEPAEEAETFDPSTSLIGFRRPSQVCKCHGDQVCELHKTLLNAKLDKAREPEKGGVSLNRSMLKQPRRKVRHKSQRGKLGFFRHLIIKYRSAITSIVTRPIFNIFSAIAVLLNTFGLLLIGQVDSETEIFLIVADKIFRYGFTAEILVKIIGMGQDFLSDICIVDSLIVMLNLFAGMYWEIRGISIMRLWLAIPYMEKLKFLHHLILLQRVMMNALASLVYLISVLILTIYIFAVIGFNFFSVKSDFTDPGSLSSDKFSSPWSFQDFGHSLLIVFRVLCGEWFFSFWECFKSTRNQGPFLCTAFFFSSLICINIVLLNLILGVLLDCFDETNLADEDDDVLRDQASMLQAIDSDAKIIDTKMLSHGYMVPIPFLSDWLEKIKVFFEEETISELVFVIIIIINCLFQCFEDSQLENRVVLWYLAKSVYVMSSLAFLLETAIKLLLQGMSFKFSDWWNILEIILSTIFIADMITFHSRTMQALRVLRAFRLLQPFTTQRRWRGFLLSASVITRSVTAIINVLFIVLYYWCVFSVIGVSLFRDKLYRCKHGKMILKSSEVRNKTECLNKNYTWENYPVNFDHVGKGYLALFQVGTFEGWTEIMEVTSAARGNDLQPEPSTSLTPYLYFVVFIIAGVLIALQLFVGVIVQHFDILRRHADCGVRELLTSQYVVKYYQAMKRIARRRPLKLASRPYRPFKAFIYDIVANSKYEKCVCIVILSYLAFDVFIYFYRDIYKSQVIQIIKMALNYVFLYEVFVEIWLFKTLHIQDVANILDFISVLLCSITTAFVNPLDVFLVDPLLLRLFRVIKTNKTFLNIKPAKQLRKLFLTLHISLASISKIAILLVLVMYVYAVIGMNLFGNSTEMSQVLNFESIMPSMMLLFYLSTTAGWNVVFAEVISNGTCSLSGQCGQYYGATGYFCTYLIICSFVLLNMFVAILLENFNEIQESKDLGFEEEDLDVLYHAFSKLDPNSTGYIPVLYLSDFYSSLPDPFTINKPNKLTIIIMNILVCKGLKVHFVDICSALFAFMLGSTGEKVEETLKQLLEPRFLANYPERQSMNVIGTTRNLRSHERILRQPGEPSPSNRNKTQAIKIIQKAWRYYRKRGKS